MTTWSLSHSEEKPAASALAAGCYTGAGYPLHHHLLRNLGVIFHEALWLEDLAADCAADQCYEGLYVASPLKMLGVSGSPVNPLFVK